MQYALIRHKVTDYDLWKPIFDEHGAARKANGISGHQLFRNINDQSEVIILVEVDDLDKVREFVQSEDLREAMQSSGVADQPDMYFLDEIERASY
jgi:heme-degrading monooxygenase HmoA